MNLDPTAQPATAAAVEALAQPETAAPRPTPASAPTAVDPLWYKDAVIYQTHVKAFCDANGDGVVNANDLAWTGGLAPADGANTPVALYRQHCASCHRDDLQGSPPQIPISKNFGTSDDSKNR